MGIVSNSVLIISGVYLALGLIYLRFWSTERVRAAYLAFSICCLSYSIYAWFELGMMRSRTPDEYLFYAWWSYFPGCAGLIAFGWFAYLHLYGRKWLFVTHSAARILAVGLHLVMANGIHFRQITSVGQRTILGEALSYPIAVSNPWMLLPHLSHVLLVIFFLDSSVRCWRRGEHRRAVVFGTGTILFGMVTLIVPTSVLWGLIPIPIFGSFAVAFIVLAMLYDLNYDMHRAAMLGEELEERDARLTETLDQLQLAASAGNVGMWTRSTDGEIIWTSEKAAEIWGFSSGERFTQNDLVQKVHPGDLERVVTCLQELASGKKDYQIEFRIVAADGNIRWISSQGRLDNAEGASTVRGALVDITRQKMAESAVRKLSHKLITAQEKERARVALELHDDLNQNIALLSIQLGMLRKQPKNLAFVSDQLGQFVTDVERLSKDVHRISYELHPAKLTQLGLEVAVRGFCREFSEKHGLVIDFVSKDLPYPISKEASLCLYRVTQESLQNVVKHSKATTVNVSLGGEGDEVVLTIFDNGRGFNFDTGRSKGGLGLVSIDERARHVNGRARVTSTPGEGTSVEVRIPID